MTFDRSMLSIVIPVYNEEDCLPELASRLAETMEQLDFEAFEVLLVSDGSTDSSEKLIEALAQDNPAFLGVFLTRNFGHQAAIAVGLSQARGSVVGIMDSDLQDPPEMLGRLVEELERGADVAYGIRTRRKEGAAKRGAYRVFYRLLGRIADIPIPIDAGDFSVMTRRVVDSVLRSLDSAPFIRGIRAWVGYRQVPVEYERSERFAGRPKYTLRKLFALAYDGLFSFSVMPVRIIQWLGFAVASLALAVALGYFGWYLAAPAAFPSGFATLTISLWFIGGVQLLFLGVIGEYVHRTFSSTLRRPVALVREVVMQPTSPNSKPEG